MDNRVRSGYRCTYTRVFKWGIEMIHRSKLALALLSSTAVLACPAPSWADLLGQQVLQSGDELLVYADDFIDVSGDSAVVNDENFDASHLTVINDGLIRTTDGGYADAAIKFYSENGPAVDHNLIENFNGIVARGNSQYNSGVALWNYNEAATYFRGLDNPGAVDSEDADGLVIDGYVNDIEVFASVDHNEVYNAAGAYISAGSGEDADNAAVDLGAWADNHVHAGSVLDDTDVDFDFDDGYSNDKLVVSDIHAGAFVEHNLIDNAGSMAALNDSGRSYGIRLYAGAHTSASASADQFAYGTYAPTEDIQLPFSHEGSFSITTDVNDISAYALVDSNDIYNSGNIIGDERGVVLEAHAHITEASAAASSSTYTEDNSVHFTHRVEASVSNVNAESYVTNNYIINELGVSVEAQDDSSISLLSQSIIENIGAAASIDHYVNNTGYSYSEPVGILQPNIEATVSDVWSISEIANNTVINAGNLISRDQDGIDIEAESIVGNNGEPGLVNDGMRAVADNGSAFGDSSDGAVYAAKAVMDNVTSVAKVDNNYIANTGYIYMNDDGSGDGVSIDAYSHVGNAEFSLGGAPIFGFEDEVIVALGVISSNSLVMGDIRYAEATTSEIYSGAFITDNVIINAGVIDGTARYSDDAQGIEIEANGRMLVGAAAFVDGEDADVNVTNAWADGVVADNVIINTGSISVYGESSEGITLDADADAAIVAISFNGFDGQGFAASASINGGDTTPGEAGSYAASIGNFVSNVGSIETYGDDSTGIEIDAWSGTIAVAYSGADVFSSAEIHHVYARAGTSDNRVYNSGSIETYGNSSSGILIDAEAGLYAVSVSYAEFGENRAGISQSGAHARVTDNVVANYGTIKTGGYIGLLPTVDAADYASHGISITANAYTVAIADTNGVAEDFRSLQAYVKSEILDNVVVNTGSIRTYAAYSNGINIKAGAFIGGPVEPDVYDISAERGIVGYNTITNDGEIVVLGRNADGIYIAGHYEEGISNVQVGGGLSGEPGDDWNVVRGNVINNSGKIVAAYGNAIHVHGTYNTFNFSAPSFFGGGLYVGGTTSEDSAAVVNIETGPSHSVNWHINGYLGFLQDRIDVLSGGVPYAIVADGQYQTTFATFDPTGVSAAPNVISDMSSAISGMVADQYKKYGSNRAWISFTQGAQEYKGNNVTTLDQDTRNRAVAVGLSGDLAEGLSVGGVAGYGWNKAEANSVFTKSIDNEAEGFFGGVYANLKAGILDFSAGIVGGKLSHKDKRFVNDNLADNGNAAGAYNGFDNGDATLGEAWAKADYDSWWFTPEAALALNFKASESTTLRPYGKVQYVNQSIDSRSEQTDYYHVPNEFDDWDGGLVETAWIGSQDVEMLNADVGMDIEYSWSGLSARIGGGYQFRENLGDDSVEGELLGQEISIPIDVTNGSAPYASAGLLLEAGSWTLGGNGRAVFRDGDIGYQFGVMAGAKF